MIQPLRLAVSLHERCRDRQRRGSRFRCHADGQVGSRGRVLWHIPGRNRTQFRHRDGSLAFKRGPSWAPRTRVRQAEIGIELRDIRLGEDAPTYPVRADSRDANPISSRRKRNVRAEAHPSGSRHASAVELVAESLPGAHLTGRIDGQHSERDVASLDRGLSWQLDRDHDCGPRR